MKKLNGEVILVLGATGGLGQAFSKRIVEEGGRVILASRNEKALLNLQQKIDPHRKQTIVWPTDASKNNEVTYALNSGVNRFAENTKAIVICIGNHVASGIKDSTEKALGIMGELLESMVIPTFNAIHEAQLFFREQGKGWIVNTSSHVVFKDEKELEDNEAYRVAKAAGDKHLWSLLPFLKDDGVRGTNLRPATINTPGNEGFLDTPEKKAAAIQPEYIADWFIDNFYNPEPPADIYFPSGATW